MAIGDKLPLLTIAPQKFAMLAYSMGQRVRYYRSYRCACKERNFNDDYYAFSSDNPKKDCPTCRGNGRIYKAYEDYSRILVSAIHNEKMRDRIGEGEIGDMLLTIPYYTWDKSSVPWHFVHNNIWDVIGEGDKVILLDVKQRIEDVIKREHDYRLRNIFIDSILDVRSWDKVLTEGLQFTLTDNNKIDFNDHPVKGKRLRLDLDVSKSLKQVGGGYIRDKYGNWNKLTMIDSLNHEFVLDFTEDYNTDQILHNEFVGFAETGQMEPGTIFLWGQITTVTNQTIDLNGQYTFYLDATSTSSERYAVQYLIQPTYIVYREIPMNRRQDAQLLPKRCILKKKDFIDP